MSSSTVPLTKTAPGRRPAPGSGPVVRLTLRQLRWLALALLVPAGETAATLWYRYRQWGDAEQTRAGYGSHRYHFDYHVPYNAYTMTDRLLADGQYVTFLPALLAAALAAGLTAHEWGARRVAFTLTQSVSPVRWFATRWTLLAALPLALAAALLVLYRLNVTHAYRQDLLTYGGARHTLYFTTGPATLAYVLLGTAAGALAGTVLRRTGPALLAGPAALMLVVAVLVRSRLAALIDYPLFSRAHGFHHGGVAGLQFFHLLPDDISLDLSLQPSDYWPYQLIQSGLALLVAAVFTWWALRIVRRRTGHA